MTNTDHLFRLFNRGPNSIEPINFIETRLHNLSPFSAHEVKIDGEVYKTAEYAYETLRVIQRYNSRL